MGTGILPERDRRDRREVPGRGLYGTFPGPGRDAPAGPAPAVQRGTCPAEGAAVPGAAGQKSP